MSTPYCEKHLTYHDKTGCKDCKIKILEEIVSEDAISIAAFERREEAHKATINKGQYMVCEEHPFLTTTSPTAAALGCPYCTIKRVSELKRFSVAAPHDEEGPEYQSLKMRFVVDWNDLQKALKEQSDG